MGTCRPKPLPRCRPCGAHLTIDHHCPVLAERRRIRAAIEVLLKSRGCTLRYKPAPQKPRGPRNCLYYVYGTAPRMESHSIEEE